ncbi:protein SPMIP7 [Osmerus eperlanus]|uniref:protein SPMIP7 n=1 Tax=Osmerus eperlanus TaxID=29151 RepID=UPI002E11917C
MCRLVYGSLQVTEKDPKRHPRGHQLLLYNVVIGWTSHAKVRPAPHKVPCPLKFFSFSPGPETTSDVSSSGPTQWIDKAALRFIYTSSAQRSFEDVRWDIKLPQRLKPPATTLEKMADPVNQHFTLKRYNSKPELWQSVEAQWKRHQLRVKNEVRKPISFNSPCPKSGQIPLYSGVVAFKNIDDIDDVDQDFYPLTMQRTTLPPYTPTTHRPTIPGYTGKANYDVGLNSGFSLPVLPSYAHNSWTTRDPWVPAYGRTAPLSKMVTTVHPHNPFRHPKRPVFLI